MNSALARPRFHLSPSWSMPLLHLTLYHLLGVVEELYGKEKTFFRIEISFARFIRLPAAF